MVSCGGPGVLRRASFVCFFPPDDAEPNCRMETHRIEACVCVCVRACKSGGMAGSGGGRLGRKGQFGEEWEHCYTADA